MLGQYSMPMDSMRGNGRDIFISLSQPSGGLSLQNI